MCSRALASLPLSAPSSCAGRECPTRQSQATQLCECRLFGASPTAIGSGDGPNRSDAVVQFRMAQFGLKRTVVNFAQTSRKRAVDCLQSGNVVREPIWWDSIPARLPGNRARRSHQRSRDCLPGHTSSMVQLQMNVSTARSIVVSCTVLIFVTIRLFPSDLHFSLAASSAFS